MTADVSASKRWFSFGARTNAEGVDWDAVYAAELPRIYNYFRYRVSDRPLAEDLTATTFEKAWRARAQYREDRAGFSTWLLTIARNVATDHFRRPRVEAPLDAFSQTLQVDAPDAAVTQRAEVEWLGARLKQLADRDRELLALKYGVGITNREIAQLTGLSESNVGTRLHRIIESLRSELKEEE